MTVDTKKQLLERKRFWAGILLAQFVLFYIFSKIDLIISLNGKFFEWQNSIHQKIFSVFPFSVGDVFYSLLGLGSVYFLFKIFRKKKIDAGILIFANLIYFVYQMFWGMLYFQKPLVEKLSDKKPTLEEAKSLAEKYLQKCIEQRQYVKTDENGVFQISDKTLIENEILKRQHLLPKNLTDKKATGIHSFKPSVFSGIMSYAGILGYYNPFTAEAQYNKNLPSSYLPFTLAHESAHQIGFAREQEANFIAYLIGKDSDNPDLKYATNYHVLKSLLSNIYVYDPKYSEAMLEQYSAGMKRDRRNEKKFIEEHRGYMDEFFGITNNLFLKMNQQEGSITYSYFVDLLIRYERNSSL
ncbi:MAG: DUF3810 domain-containing protein [Bergeyella sp.]